MDLWRFIKDYNNNNNNNNKNSKGNHTVQDPNLSGGAPHFIMCLCLQSRKDVSCSLI